MFTNDIADDLAIVSESEERSYCRHDVVRDVWPSMSVFCSRHIYFLIFSLRSTTKCIDYVFERFAKFVIFRKIIIVIETNSYCCAIPMYGNEFAGYVYKS